MLIHVRNKWSWQRSAPKFRPVFTVTSVPVSGTTCTPSYMTPNQLHQKHTTFSPWNQCSPPKIMSVTPARAALFCEDERRTAAKLTVSRREVSCGEVYEHCGRIWHQHYRKAEHVFVNGKREYKDTFCRKSWSYERVYWSQGAQQPQHGDRQFVLQYAGYSVSYMQHLISASQENGQPSAVVSNSYFLFVF